MHNNLNNLTACLFHVLLLPERTTWYSPIRVASQLSTNNSFGHFGMVQNLVGAWKTWQATTALLRLYTHVQYEFLHLRDGLHNIWYPTNLSWIKVWPDGDSDYRGINEISYTSKCMCRIVQTLICENDATGHSESLMITSSTVFFCFTAACTRNAFVATCF